MHRRCDLAHLILAVVIVLSLTFLMVCVDAQAQIAFSSNRDGNHEIYVMDADGTNQRRLTNNPASDYSPSWSPDGKRMAFVSRRDGHVHPIDGWRTSEIYVMDADGNNQQRLTDNDFYDTHPSWSPDGERIAFISRRAGHFIGEFGLSSEIYVMDADGKNTRRLTNNRKTDVSPSWSSDGKRIVFSSYRDGNAEIYVMDNDGGNQQKLTNNPPHTNGGPAWFGPAFAVAPTGKKFTTWGWLKQVDR